MVYIVVCPSHLNKIIPSEMFHVVRLIKNGLAKYYLIRNRNPSIARLFVTC